MVTEIDGGAIVYRLIEDKPYYLLEKKVLLVIFGASQRDILKKVKI